VTVEAEDSTEWLARIPSGSLLVVDCIGTLLGRVMEECWPDRSGTLADAAADVLPDGYSERVSAVFDVIVRDLFDRGGDTIVVTNEVGASVVPMWASARLFSDLMGRGNRELVRRSDRAYLAVCGRLLDLSSLPDVASWPETQEGV
jgi:adenosylcobinamide kinase/adenosylcobinamide-phosphate guanylyltransferase